VLGRSHTNWVDSQCTTQFAVVATNYSALSSDETRSDAVLFKSDVRWTDNVQVKGINSNAI